MSKTPAEHIKKIFIAFELDKAVSDVTRLEVEYSDSSFTLLALNNGFETEKEAEQFIITRMKDYKNRGVDRSVRFTIIPVYVFDDDKEYMPAK